MIRINEMLRRRDEGFTLIELMVVVLIIGILIAIAIPTFLGARKRAQDRAAQSSLRNTVTAAKTIFTDNEDYADATASSNAKLTASEPSLTFVLNTAPSTDATTVSTKATGGPPADTFYAAAFSKSPQCWYLRDVTVSGATGGTKWAKGGITSAGCTADAANTYAGLWYKSPGDVP